MARSWFVFLPMVVLLGGALASYGIDKLSTRKSIASPCKVVPVEFTEVQRAVAKVHTAHVVFRMISDDISTPVLLYEAWLKADSPAFAVRIPNGRIVGDGTGVRRIMVGNLPESLSHDPITESEIHREMLLPRFDIQNSTNRYKWGKGAVEQDAVGRNLLRFAAEEKGVHRTLWVDPKTHLPVRLNVEIGSALASYDTVPSRLTNQFHILYYYNKTSPPDIFEAPEESSTLLAVNAILTK